MTDFKLAGAPERIPFELVGSLHACNCPEPAQALRTARKADRLIPEANGLWAFYIGFWGEYARIFTLSIVDVRDGTIMWRNGRHLLQEDESGNKIQLPRDHVCGCGRRSQTGRLDDRKDGRRTSRGG